MAEIGYTGLNPGDLGRLVQDPYEEELNVMADVTAYFHVAYKVGSTTTIVVKCLKNFFHRKENYRRSATHIRDFLKQSSLQRSSQLALQEIRD